MKIDRARSHVDALAVDIIRFMKTKNYTVEEVPDFQAGEKTAFYRVTKPFPDEWPVIIGEIAHNLRSALDHSIYELTVMETGNPLDNTEFPVFEDETKYSALKNNGQPTRISGLFKIRGISARAQTVVRDLQPFEFQKQRGKGNESVVSLVHHLNRIDKHQTLHLCRRRTSEFFAKVIRDLHPIENVFPLGELKDDLKLARWKPADRELDDEPDMEFKIGFQIAFGDTAQILHMQPVIPTCQGLVRGIERVLFHLERSVSSHSSEAST